MTDVERPSRSAVRSLCDRFERNVAKIDISAAPGIDPTHPRATRVAQPVTGGPHLGQDRLFWQGNSPTVTIASSFGSFFLLHVSLSWRQEGAGNE
jgi:hypothetical protein